MVARWCLLFILFPNACSAKFTTLDHIPCCYELKQHLPLSSIVWCPGTEIQSPLAAPKKTSFLQHGVSSRPGYSIRLFRSASPLEYQVEPASSQYTNRYSRRYYTTSPVAPARSQYMTRNEMRYKDLSRRIIGDSEKDPIAATKPDGSIEPANGRYIRSPYEE